MKTKQSARTTRTIAVSHAMPPATSDRTRNFKNQSQPAV